MCYNTLNGAAHSPLGIEGNNIKYLWIFLFFNLERYKLN